MAQKQFHFDLKPSETAIFRGAANIYAAYVSSGQATPENNKEMMKRAISIAIAMARGVDDAVKSDDEISIRMGG